MCPAKSSALHTRSVSSFIESLPKAAALPKDRDAASRTNSLRLKKEVMSASVDRLWVEARQDECDSFSGRERQVMAESRRSSVELLTSSHIAFGKYRFNPGTGELWRGDKEIKLT